MANLRSAEELVRRVAIDQRLQSEIQADPVKGLNELAAKVIQENQATGVPDNWIYRLVVLALGIAVVLVVVGAIALSFKTGSAIPELMTAIGSAAVGALAGLLAPSPVPGSK